MTRPLTLREVADALGCTPSTARRLVTTGKLAALRIVGRGQRGTYRVEEPELAAYKRRILYAPFTGPTQVTRVSSSLLIDMVRPARRKR